MPVAARVLHLLDADAVPDPLFLAVVGDGDRVIRRQLRNALLAWRAAGEVRALAREFDAVVAWGDRAGALARRANVNVHGCHCFYRPTADRWQPLLPDADSMAIASSQTEQAHLTRLGWPAARCRVLYPAVAEPGPSLEREALGLADDDFVWLLDGTASPNAGLRDAVWAGALMHVMERNRRRHRLLIWDSGARAHRRALTFVDQLGLPGLAVAARGMGGVAYESLVPMADAMLLTPTGPCPPWGACVAAVTGIPVVAMPRPEVREVLDGRPGARFAPEDRSRVVVREMLRLSENLPARAESDERFTVGTTRAAWVDLLDNSGR